MAMTKSQQPSPYGGTQRTIVQDGKPPMSIWLPVGFLAGWICCFIAGAGLIAAYESTASCQITYQNGNQTNVCTGGKKGELYAGVAFILIAVALKLVFWVLLIMRCYQRRRNYTSVTTIVDGNGYGNGYGNEQSVPLNQYAPQQEQNTAYHPHPQYAPGQTSYPSQVYQ